MAQLTTIVRFTALAIVVVLFGGTSVALEGRTAMTIR
jgi:hypothetical protein